MTGDGEGPGREARTPLPPRSRGHDLEPRLLGEILGARRIAGEPAEERMERGAMAAQEGLEGADVARLVPPHELLVARSGRHARHGVGAMQWNARPGERIS